MSNFALRRDACHIASISALLNWSGWSFCGEATGIHRTWRRRARGAALLNFVALRCQIEEGIDQYYPTNGYAFGVNKPRRTQITQRPNSSSARGVVPACPARCLRWSPNVQMPAPSGTKIGAVSSAVRGVEVLFPLLTASLRSTSLPSLRNDRTEVARVLLTSACSLGRLCCGLLALPTRNGKQHLALSLNPLAPLPRRRGCGFFLCNAAAE